jgi:hypothetical protein
MNDRYWVYKYRNYRAMAIAFGFLAVLWGLLLFTPTLDAFAFALGLTVVISSSFTAGYWFSMMVDIHAKHGAAAAAVRAGNGGGR